METKKLKIRTNDKKQPERKQINENNASFSIPDSCFYYLGKMPYLVVFYAIQMMERRD